MIRMKALVPQLLAATLLLPVQAAQPSQQPNPQALAAAQKAAMAPLAWMDGVWRGPARHTDMNGTVHEVVQTERIGPFLDGALKVIEGRGYNADGSVGFNAFAILSWDAQKQAYNFRSHAMGRVADLPFRATADGYMWEIPAGPMTIRYTTTFKDGVWHEVGDRIVEGASPVRFFEMTLQRMGDSSWPAGGAIPMN